MPSFNLCRDGGLDSLAPFKLLAAMCHPGPNDRIAREEMVALLQNETGLGAARRRAVKPEQFRKRFIDGSNKGGGAGSLLMARLQLQQNGEKPSLNRALPLAMALLPEFWPTDDPTLHRPRSRTNMLRDYRTFLSVAHLWAAAIHGLEHQRADIWPGSLQTLPTFLAYADSFLDLAGALPDRGRNQRYALTRSVAWTFVIPEGLVQSTTLVALPFSAAQRRVIDEG